MQCERCGAGPAGADLFDRCAVCGVKLCDECMAAGCCGHAPALSAREADARQPDISSSEGSSRRSSSAPEK